MVNGTKQSQTNKILGADSVCSVDQTFLSDSPQTKYIELSKGKKAKIDIEDYDMLSQYKWYLLKSSKIAYDQAAKRLYGGFARLNFQASFIK